MGADAEQPPQHVGYVAAEQAAVRVQFVDDDDPELLEQLEPLGVVRQDCGVEHVRVGHDDLSGGSDAGPDRIGRVAVVCGAVDLQPGGAAELAEFRHLVLAECLRGEEEQRSGRRIVGEGLQGGHQIAQRLARGGRRDHDHVVAGPDGFDGLRLMPVQAGYAPGAKAGHDPRIQPVRHRHEIRFSGGDGGLVYHAARQRRLGQDLGQHPLHPGRLVVAHRQYLKENVRANRHDSLAAWASVRLD